MDSQQQSAKSRDGKEQSDKPSDVDNRPLAPSFVDRVVENFDSAKRRVRGLNLESDGVTDIVTLLNDEFRLERRVGNAEGEGGGKSESWIAERINSPGEKVFLKKFNSPKHPTLEEIRDTEFGRNSKRRCERFAQHHEQMRSKRQLFYELFYERFLLSATTSHRRHSNLAACPIIVTHSFLPKAIVILLSCCFC